MNILQVNNYHFVKGGSERYYFELSKLLKEYGHNILYFSVHDQNNILSEFSNYFGSSMSFDTGQNIIKKIETAFRMLYSFENNNKIRKLLNDYKVDIAHTHNIYHRVCPSVFDVLRKRGVPIIMTLHDYKLGCSIYNFYRNDYICEECISIDKQRVFKNRCTKGSLMLSLFHWLEFEIHNNVFDIYRKNVVFFVCPSLFSLKKHAEIGIPEEKLIHIPNFINTDTINPNYNKGDYILFVGRLSKEKGILTLLKAVKGLNVVIRIVGDGPMRIEYENYARKNEISNVIFEGYKSGEELRDFFKNAAFLIIPSEWYENAPMTILESFAYGKPVIGSNIGGIPEMVRHGESGLLFEMGNAEDLRTKIKEMLSSPSKITEMGQRARKIVEDEYNAEVHCKRLMEAYKRIS
jgi:glycosyltransferase involved in cell wall biosynthesis